MPVKAVFFDLGGTLIEYYSRNEWPGILKECISGVADLLQDRGLNVGRDVLDVRASGEDFEQTDFRVRPLIERLNRVFAPAGGIPSGLEGSALRAFMQPIFRLGRLYADAIPVLERARDRGYALGIVSNTPWGSPSYLWREELARYGLLNLVDLAIFCVDVGYRKPARPIFEEACRVLAISPREGVFIGDDPRWDTTGAASVGMAAILIRREEARVSDQTCTPGVPVTSGLAQVLDLVDVLESECC